MSLRTSLPSNALAGKTVVFDRNVWPTIANSVANQYGETWRYVMRAQNSATNLRFVFPNMGIYDQSAGKILQKSEQQWPFAFNLSACFEVPLYSGKAASLSAGVLTDQNSGVWVQSQWLTPTLATGTLTVSAAGSTVSTATNATPIVVTTTGSHGLVTGQAVTISGVVGNTAANGTFLVTVTDGTNFSLRNLLGVSVAGNGAYVSGGAVAAGIPTGSLTIPLTGATTVTLRKDGVLPIGSRMVRLSADVAIGATSLPIYPQNGALTNADTATTVIYRGPIYQVLVTSGSSNQRMAYITANTANTLSVPNGLTTMAAGDSYRIVALYPLTFSGDTSPTMKQQLTQTSDMLPVSVNAGDHCAVRVFPSGASWPTGAFAHKDVPEMGAEGSFPVDFCFSNISQGGAVSSFGYPMVANYGDPVGTPNKVVVSVGDSITRGTGDQTVVNNYVGYLARAAFLTNSAHLNLGIGNEGGWPGAMKPEQSQFRQEMMQLADTVTIAFGTNDELDGTVGPLSAPNMRAMMLAWARLAQAAGVRNIMGVTVGPLTGSTVSGFFPGNEATQTASQPANIQDSNNFLLSLPGFFNRCFDFYSVLGLTGANQGKWKTFPSIISGTCAGTQSATKLVDTSGQLDAVLPNWAFAVSAKAQIQFQGCGVKLTHLGSDSYNYVKATDGTVTAGELIMGANWGFTPTAGDPYVIYPIATSDGTHPTAYGHWLLANALAAYGL